MITNYPFSVILDVPHNPYLASGGSTQKYMPFNKNTAETAMISYIQTAANRIKTISEQQRNAYVAFDALLKLNGNGVTLENIFQKQYILFEDTSILEETEIKKLTDVQEEYIEQIRKKQANFHSNFLASVNRIVQATDPEQLEQYKIEVQKDAKEIDILLQQALTHFKDEKIVDKLKRVKKTQKEDLHVKIKQGQLEITSKDGTKLNDQFGAVDSYYKTLLKVAEAVKEYEKGHGVKLGARFAQSSTFKKEYQKLFQDYQNQTKFFEAALDQYTRQSRREINRFFKNAIFNNIVGEDLFIHSIKHGDYLVSASSFAFEQTSIEQLRNEIIKAINNEEKVHSYVINVPLRIQLKSLPLASEKEKVLNELYFLSNNIDIKLNELYRSQKVLDKVDTYLSVNFSKNDKYILAFSNKLYHDLERLRIVGKSKKNNSMLTEEAEDLLKQGTNLINTYDLIGQIGELADDFMFSILNASTASGLHNSIDKQSLENWLNSFIYELAFNPRSFIQSVESTLQENIQESKTIYFFNAGSKIEPVYKILDNIYNFLISTSFNLQSCITTKIQYDNSNGQTLLNEVNDKYPSGEPFGKYTEEDWNQVANRVAQNTLLTVHLDLLKLTDFNTII